MMPNPDTAKEDSQDEEQNKIPLLADPRAIPFASLSGTPTGWINSASQRVVEIYCECDPQVAAARFIERNRHPGHLDSLKRVEDVLTSFQTLAARGPLGIGKLLRVDTSGEIEFEK